MATNWTDATLFVKDDVVLPKLMADLEVADLDADIYFHDKVKEEIGTEIRYRFHDVPSFDIEEITAASILELKQTALYLNLNYICRDEVVSALEDDTFSELGMHYRIKYEYWLKRKIELLEFDEPDGINDLKAFSIPIKR